MSKYNGNYDSNVNQRIKGEFVEREVYGCDETVVTYILNKAYEDPDAPFCWDDVENYYTPVCPHCNSNGTLEEVDEDEIVPIHKWKCNGCEELYDTEEEALNCAKGCEVEDDEPVSEVWLCPLCEDEYETEEDAQGCVCHYKEKVFKCSWCDTYHLESDVDSEPQEIYTWYRVSDFLYHKLLEHGEPVLDGPNAYYWGRGTFGQAILLDGVISEICAEMGILEGQEHDWSKHWN